MLPRPIVAERFSQGCYCIAPHYRVAGERFAPRHPTIADQKLRQEQAELVSRVRQIGAAYKI